MHRIQPDFQRLLRRIFASDALIAAGYTPAPEDRAMPRLTFTLRDLFWIMFLVGFSLWSLNYRRQIVAEKQAYCDKLRIAIVDAEAAKVKAIEKHDEADAIVRYCRLFIRRLNEDFQRLDEESRSYRGPAPDLDLPFRQSDFSSSAPQRSGYVIP
jgi:hypothetical protein